MTGLSARFVKAISFTLLCIATCADVQGQDTFDPVPGFINIDFTEGGNQESNLVSRFHQDRFGYLWVSTHNGLYRYDGSELRTYFNSADTTTISNNSQSCVFEDNTGRLWIGTRGNGLDLYDRVHDNFKRNADPIRNDLIIWSMHQVDDTTLWVGGRDYLIRFDMARNTCEYFDLPKPSEHFNTIRDITPDPSLSSRLWLGTIYGLFSFDTNTKEFTEYGMPPGYSGPNRNNTYLLMEVFASDLPVIWASSWGGGIIEFNINTNEWKREKIYPRHTDPNRWNDVVLDMQIKNGDEYWVATSHGFGKFNKVTRKYSLFDEGENPLLKPSFNYDGILTLSDGRIVTGRYGGFSISQSILSSPDRATYESYVPEIRNIQIDGQPYFSDSSLAFINFVEIDEDEKDIAISISTPGVIDDNDLIYSYRLKGYDRDWHQGNESVLRYTNLNPGTYSLQVRTSHDGEKWAYAPRTLNIKKSGYPWQKPWFYILILSIVLGVIGLIYWINIRSIKRTAQIKSAYDQKIAGVEMAALRAQMNPHFMFNSLNSIKAYILKEKTEEASEYLTKFSRLMRAVLRNSKNPLVTLEDELSALTLYVELESLRFEDEFSYEISVDESIDKDAIVIPPLLIQPYVENAIRHGLLEKENGSKELLITVSSTEQNEILIVIQDNGIGREAASKKRPLRSTKNRSFGMEITGDRISLIEQTLGIHANVKIIDLYENNTPGGTRVELRIPYIPASQSLT